MFIHHEKRLLITVKTELQHSIPFTSKLLKSKNLIILSSTNFSKDFIVWHEETLNGECNK